jgi:hypothetical protein
MDGLSVLCQDPSGWLSDAPVYKTSDWSDFATLLSDALSDSAALDAKQAEVVSQEVPSEGLSDGAPPSPLPRPVITGFLLPRMRASIGAVPATRRSDEATSVLPVSWRL